MLTTDLNVPFLIYMLQRFASYLAEIDPENAATATLTGRGFAIQSTDRHAAGLEEWRLELYRRGEAYWLKSSFPFEGGMGGLDQPLVRDDSAVHIFYARVVALLRD